MRIHLARVKVPVLGAVHVAATNHGVVAVRLDDDGDALRAELAQRFPGAEFGGANEVTADAGREIRQYLSGGHDPDVPVVLTDDGFSSKVWNQIRRIPRGEVRTYKRIAQAVRRPTAARAVGQACGRNPVPLVIPCHRVVASDGSLGGFGADLSIKRSLLALEGVRVRG
jgi:AraC family transcriptional regulator of adaptative response/methylated-DNA-[protein]-cysteine methyltransferase